VAEMMAMQGPNKDDNAIGSCSSIIHRSTLKATINKRWEQTNKMMMMTVTGDNA
jgi:hypothetical protein